MKAELQKHKEWYQGWQNLVLCALFFTTGWLYCMIAEPSEKEVIDTFHRWYYYQDQRTWNNTFWLGVPAKKTPLDLWVVQETLHETRPDVVVEMGTYKGGSAYFFASMFDLLGHGRVLTVDIENFPGRPEHPRITYVLGDSTSESTAEIVRASIGKGEKVMVVLDSLHTKQHVLEELRLYADLVSIGNYLIVEDTNLNGHPVFPDFGPSAKEAVDEFLVGNKDFEPDRSREKFGLTFQPGGWLKRVRKTNHSTQSTP